MNDAPPHARAALVLALTLAAGGCVDNPYVIGTLPDEQDAGPAFDPCTSHPDALVCSGFERPGLDDWLAPTVLGDAAIERSTARSRSGSASLRAESSGAESTAVVSQQLEPRVDGTLHMRVWLRVPGDVATETMNLFFLGHDPNPSADPPLAFSGLDLNIEDGALQAYAPESFPDRITGALQIPRDRWFCLRAEVAIADAGSLRVLVDDALALEADPLDTLPDAGGIGLLRAGVDWSSGQSAPFEVFMDDLVLSEAPVPCSAP